jgi:iron(III) transport system substrate-binding protein
MVRKEGFTRREALITLATGAAAMVLAACGGGAAPAASSVAPAGSTAAKPASAAPASGGASAKPAASGAAVAKPAGSGAAPASGLPSYYPADYGQLVEASRKENKLLIYSIMSKQNWAPVIDEFKKRYSWLDIDAPDLDSATIFDRYYTESAGNARTADMIITSSPDTWQDFIKKGEGVVYKSPEDGKVPDWSKPAPGVYTVSSDPMVIMWNKKLIPNPPKSMAELADMAGKDPGKFTPGRIVTYEESNATGFAGHWFWAKKVGQDKALEILTTIGKTKPKLESSGGRMVDATLAGETLIGYFVSAITILPKFPAANDILGYQMIADGTPVVTRAMAVTKKAQAPNGAKLLLDFILSPEGQIAWAKGGLTPYRSDVADKASTHLDKLAAQVGQQNLLPFSFDPDIADQTKREDFRAKLKKALGR